MKLFQIIYLLLFVYCYIFLFLFLLVFPQKVIRVDGSQHYRKTIISNTGKPEGVGEPIGIALDPTRG